MYRPSTKKTQEPQGLNVCGTVFEFPLVSPVWRRKHDVTHFTLHRQRWLEKSSGSRAAAGGVGWWGLWRGRVLKKMKKSVLFTTHALDVFGCRTITVVGSSPRCPPTLWLCLSTSLSLSYIIELRLKDVNFPSIQISL